MTTEMPKSNQEHLLESIAQEARVQKARLLPTDRELEKHEIIQIGIDLRNFLTERDHTAKWFAKQLGVAPSVVSEFMAGTYNNGNLQEIARKTNAALDLIIAAERVRAPKNYVTTRVATLIMAAIKMAYDRRQFAEITGDAGFGKTVTAEAAQLKFPGAVYHRVTASTKDGYDLCEALLRKVARQRQVPYGRKRIYDTLIEKLSGSDRVLLIDEAHRLSASGREMLRDILDTAHVGIVLFGNDSLYEQIERERSSRRGQFSSRFVTRLRLDLLAEQGGTDPGNRLFTPEDIVRIFEDHRLRLNGDAADLVSYFASTPGTGGLRIVDTLTYYTSMLPEFSGKVVTIKTIIRILNELDQELKHQVEASNETRMRAIASA